MNREAARVFSRVILAEKTVRIKLLGDSITHGVGGTGFKQNGEKITDKFSRNPDGFCWAKLFKEHMESRYNCRVTNNACTGTDIRFILQHFDELVSEEDDIVVCTIGTNNRHQYFETGEKQSKEQYMRSFYRNILALYEKFREAGKDVIFCANIPASQANERDGENYWRIFHMDDVRDMYRLAAEQCGFPLISFYDGFAEYCLQKNIPLEILLRDGLHPNDEGYRVMFSILMREIGLASLGNGYPIR